MKKLLLSLLLINISINCTEHNFWFNLEENPEIDFSVFDDNTPLEEALAKSATQVALVVPEAATAGPASTSPIGTQSKDLIPRQPQDMMAATTAASFIISKFAPQKIEGGWKCPICGYQNKHKNTLAKHIKTHTGERRHKCKLCDYAATQKVDLTRHMKKHTGEGAFKCEQCSFTAAYKSDLAKHMMTHTGEKPHKCKQCDYAATHKSALTKHMRKHTDERPFKCEQCDYAAKQKINLTRHMMTHTGERPYACPYCDHRTTQESHLPAHIKNKHS